VDAEPNATPQTISPPSDPWVTMLLLAYNQQDSIAQAIAGALSQTYQPLEIVLSDDASSDATFAAMQAAVRDYAGPHRIVLNRNDTNLGIGGNLNRMVALSRGELLFIAAGDDISVPQRCETVVRAWLDRRREPDLIAAALVDMDLDGRLHGTLRPSDLSPYRNAADWIARPPYVVGAAQAWTRRVFDRFGPLPQRTMGEDRLMVFRAILSGGAITLPDTLVQYRRGGISRRQRTFSAPEVVDRLLKNNRSALVELPQLLADARTGGQLNAVHAPLTHRLHREEFIRDMFAPRMARQRWALVRAARDVPLSVRLRMLTYAQWPWLLAPLFAVKRHIRRGD